MDNGGPTFTHLPNIGSPVLNVGDNASAPANDQRGSSFTRIIDTTIDIGAVELQTTQPSVVTNTNDSGPGSLRQAVLYTNNSPSLDTIDFSGIAPNQTITLNSELPITDSITISGPVAGDATSLILDGGGTNRLINATSFSSNSGETITLKNITLQNGLYHGTRTGLDAAGGAAISVKNADLVLNHSNIINNHTTGEDDEGGGVFVRSGNATLTNSLISGNSTAGNGAQGGGVTVRGNMSLTQSIIANNSTTGDDANGGGFYINSVYGDVTLNQSTVSGNSTTGNLAKGGGFYIIHGDVTLNQSTVSGNSTTGSSADGGGFNIKEGDVTLNQSTVSGNSTTGNSAKGGGFHIYSGDVTLNQSTVTNNTANYGSAGIFLYGYASDEIITFTLNMNNSILSENTDNLLPSNFVSESYTYSYSSPASVTINVNAMNSLLGTDVTPQLTGNTNTSNISNNNPDLGPLLNNGGPTFTHLPNGTSPALNAGSNAAVTFANDQRGAGFGRVRDMTVDIGAVELQAGPFTVINSNNDGAGSLRQAVDDANNSAGADAIAFDIPAGETIALSSGALDISESLTISGPTAGDAGSLILDGGDNNQLVVADFASSSGQTITLENMTLQNGLFTGPNYYTGGGAVFVNNADLVINHGKVSDNAITGVSAQGGGIYVRVGNATLNQTTVSNNSASGSSSDGAGLNVFDGNVVLTESTISGNSLSRRGGGIYINGTTTLTQSTISGNSAQYGGGIYNYGGSSTFTQSTIVNNSSVLGAGGIQASSATLTNTILSANTGVGGNFNGGSLIATNSLFGDLETEITTNDGSNVIDIDNNPKLGPLQDNGGPTFTKLPNVDSPAVNAGNNTDAMPFSSDQRGMTFPRIIDGNVDIGAVESPVFTYTKDHVIKRAEIVKPILLAAGLEPLAITSNVYDDVSATSFNATWINRFKSEGLTIGCDDTPDRFCPNSIVSKEELAKMILQVKEISPASSHTDIFSDVPSGSFNAGYIEALSTEGFTTGCAAGKFCPKDAVTIETFNNILNAAFH